MKKLSLSELEEITAGGSWGDWACGGATTGAIVGAVVRSAMGPIGWTITIGCAVYGTGRLADWW